MNVMLRPVAHVVNNAIDLDCKTRLGAVKIEDKRPNRMLAAKDRLSRRTRAQNGP
jgi:hypothetical protein